MRRQSLIEFLTNVDTCIRDSQDCLFGALITSSGKCVVTDSKEKVRIMILFFYWVAIYLAAIGSLKDFEKKTYQWINSRQQLN